MPRTIQRLQLKKYNLKNIRRFFRIFDFACVGKVGRSVEKPTGHFDVFNVLLKKITVSSLMPRTTNKIEHAYNKQIEFTFHYAK